MPRSKPTQPKPTPAVKPTATAASTDALLISGSRLHGQSDNLTAIALVDTSGDFPPECAIRWSFRYDAGFPTNGATLYRRAVNSQQEILPIVFDSLTSSADWITLGNVKVRALGGDTVISQAGLQVNKSFIVSFGFPVVSVEIVGSGNNTQQIGVVAMHYPYVVDELQAAQPVNNSSTAAVRGDIIDYLMVTVSAPMTVKELLVVPLLSEVLGSWQKIADAPLLATAQSLAATNPWGQLPATVQGQLTDAMLSLYDPSITNPDGSAIPMGDRQLNTSPPPDGATPNIQIPTLAFLRLAAVLPSTAQLLGLLIDVTASKADVANAWDYLLVGHWAARKPLPAASVESSGQRVNLIGTPEGPIALVDGLLIESTVNLAFGANGLVLGASAIWIHFTAPMSGKPSSGQAMVVELEMASVADRGVMVTAFNEFRIVDWAYTDGNLRLTVCADSIDSICVYGAGGVISAVTWNTTDPALLIAPTGNIGDVCYWMFSARNHPVPSPPQGLVVSQLEGLWTTPNWTIADSNSLPPPSLPPTYETSDPNSLTVGVRWTATPPLTDVMMFYAAAYQVLRNLNQEGAAVIAGNNTPLSPTNPSGGPLVVPSPPLPPNNIFVGSLPPNSGPWYLLDQVEAPAQVVYGVSAVDLFGRTSNPTYSPTITLSRTSPPDPPTNVQATLQDNGTIMVTWAWDGTDPYLNGFNVYFKPGSVTSSLYSGQVVSLGPPGQSTFPLSISIDTTNLDVGALSNRLIRVGDDHYIVKSAATNAPGLSLTMYLNPSTPDQMPSVGDNVMIVVTRVQPGQPINGSSYLGQPITGGCLTLNTTPYGVTTTTEGTNNSGQQILQVAASNGFVANQYVTLNRGQPNQEAAVISSIQPGPPITLTLATNLQNAHAPGESATQFKAVLTPGQGGVSWSSPDQNGISIISIGVSAISDSKIESMICGPVVVKQIPNASSLSAPPLPQATVEQIVFTGPPDAYGLCSYSYVANCTPNALYHVYRALETTLLAVDSEFRVASGNGTRMLAGADVQLYEPYDNTLYNPDGSPKNTDPLQTADFQAVTAALPDPSELTVTNWNAIANLFGNEAAFQRVTDTPISSTGNTLTFTDEGLPAGSTSKYFYRLRAVTASCDQGPFGWASSPVQLWPQPPSRPTISSLRVSGNLLLAQWNANPEPEVTGYRVYLASNILDAQDIRSMTLAVEVTSTVVNDESHVPTRTFVQIEQGQRYWVSVVAVADYTSLTTSSPNPGKVASEPSDPVSVMPQTFAAPTPPEAASVTVKAAGGQVQLTLACNPNPTTKYMLLRGLSGSNNSPTAICTWKSPAAGATSITLIDVSPLGTNVNYVIGFTNESSRISYSDPIPYSPDGGQG